MKASTGPGRPSASRQRDPSTPLPSAPELLDYLNTLDYHDRCHVEKMAHAHRHDPKLEGLVNDLWQYAEDDNMDESDRLFSRCVSLRIAIVATDTPNRENWLIQGLQSGSVMLATMCATPLAKCADTQTLKSVLPDLPPKFRRQILAAIASFKRTDVADDLLPFVLKRHFGGHDAATLLRACSSDVVSAHLPDLSHAVYSWKRLARSHSNVVLSYLQQRLEQLPGGMESRLVASVWNQVDDALHVLVIEHPQEVARLALDCLDSGYELPFGIQTRLGTMIKRTPTEVGRILVHQAYRRQLLQWRGLPPCLISPNNGRLRLLPKKFQNELICILLVESPGTLARVLKPLPPSLRGELFKNACKGFDTSSKQWPVALLDVLPHRIRNSEAKRMCEIAAIKNSQNQLLVMMSYCDILTGNVRGDLEEMANRPNAEERARGYSLLVECTGRYRQGITETLTFAARASRDQDPVRREIISSIASSLPFAQFTKDDDEILKGIVNDALVAPDISWETVSAIEKLVGQLLQKNGSDPKSGAFLLGLEILQQVVMITNRVYLPRFDKHQLSEDGAAAIYAAVEPAVLKTDDVNKPELVLGIANSLGEHAREIEGIQHVLGDAALSSRHINVANRASSIWLKDKRTRDERARLLLDKDLSSIALHAVSSHLLNRRQTWLDPYLDYGSRPIKGRFDDVDLSFPVQSGFARLAPRQQQMYRQYLLRYAGDASNHISKRVDAVKLLALLPGVTVDTMRKYLQFSLDDAAENKLLSDAAVWGLSRTDMPLAALPVLMELLDGDHVHIAMYGIQRCANLMAAQDILNSLLKILSRERLKIAVRKEAIRLVGGLCFVDESMSLLSEQWKLEDGSCHHRDVKIAFGHAARQQLHREEAWSILDDIVSDEDAIVSGSILSMDADHPKTIKRRYGELILRLVTHSDAHLRRRTFQMLPWWIDGLERDIVDFSIKALVDLDDDVVWKEALLAFVAAVRSGKCGDRLLQLVQNLLNVQVSPKYNANKDHGDLPARRRLVQICNDLQRLGESDRVRLKRDIQLVTAEIEKDCTLWEMAAQLHLAVIDWGEAISVVNTFQELAIAADQVPTWRVTQLTRCIESALRKDSSSWKPEDAKVWYERLSENTLPDCNSPSSLGYIQLVLIKAVARRIGWISPWIENLRILRQHPDVGVRTASLDVNIGEHSIY